MVFSINCLSLVFFAACLWPSFSMAALECSDLSTGGDRCADVIGLEGLTLSIQEEDLNTEGVYVEQEYCIVSYTRPSANSNENTWTREPFDVQLGGDSENGGFVLANGGDSLPVSFLWKGGAPVSGSPVWEAPGPGNLTADQQGATSCNDDPNSQAFLRFEIAGSDLMEAQSGTYTGSFNVDIGQGDTGYHSDVDFSVSLPELVKISGLDDMLLTQRNGNNDRYRQDEEFCVFVRGRRKFSNPRQWWSGKHGSISAYQ